MLRMSEPSISPPWRLGPGTAAMVARHGVRHGVLARVARQLAASAPQPPVVPDRYRHATPAADLASLPAYTLEEVRAPPGLAGI